MSPRDEILEVLGHAIEEFEILFADGFDDAILGVVERFGSQPVVLYDRTRCIEILQQKGMDPFEAEEFFDFNTTSAWVGEGTPAYAVLRRGVSWSSSTTS